MSAGDPRVSARSAHRLLGLGAVLVAIVALSLGSTVVKWSKESGSAIAFWRLVIGTMIWLGVLAVTRTPLRAADVRRTVPIGFLFGFNISLFFTAVRMTLVANVEFIGTLAPFAVIPLAAVILRERVRTRSLLFGAVALVGVAVILANSPTAAGDDNLGGDLLALGAVATWSLYLVAAKRVRQAMDTKVFMTGMTIGAVLGSAPVAIGQGDLAHLGPRGWLAAGLLAVLTGVGAHGLLVWSQRHVPVTTVSLLQLAQPGMATFWAFAVLDEGVEPVQFLGMGIVLVAVGAVAVESSRRLAAPTAQPLALKPYVEEDQEAQGQDAPFEGQPR